MLQATGVVDNKLNWSFGNGHLVLVGDFVDRGDMVMETLWLIYKLEEEAKKAGGYVHFILGNHETMNLIGDYRYVNDKYRYSAKAMGKEIKDLFSVESELGKWLRTRNIVEKVGDILFVHGGISDDVNKMNFTIPEINSIVRPHLDSSEVITKRKDTLLFTLLFNASPLWYRDYYRRSIPDVIDHTLKKFDVDHIVTGHTVVADTISTHYKGKVINIDTPHKNGKSEALLIHGDVFYRIDMEGNRKLLFDKEK